jgi:hypothetical protein
MKKKQKRKYKLKVYPILKIQINNDEFDHIFGLTILINVKL